MNGYLSQQLHPRGLGSALTNRFITTDFSEALLEFVTPVFSNTWEALRFLCDVHQFTYERLDDELLWVASMPCRTSSGQQNSAGPLRRLERRPNENHLSSWTWLSVRRHMQTIAGVHFNYSLPESFWSKYQHVKGDGGKNSTFRSDQYLGLIRNFRRFGWLLCICLAHLRQCASRSVAGPTLDIPSLSAETWYAPFGTSLRMSDLGYSNQNQSRIDISLNSLDDYIRDLHGAMQTPEPDYEKIGVKVDGEYRQLSAHSLQIENEYYSSVRPKRVAHSGEKPTAALRRGGIEYVEIRSLDINIDDPAGVNQNTMRFIEALLIYCLIEDSPTFDAAALDEVKRNQSLTAREGRDPDFRLYRDGVEVTLADWAGEILHKVAAVAELIDAAEGGDSYTQTVRLMRELVKDPAATPSARLLEELTIANCSFFDYALSVARGHRDYFASITPLSDDRNDEFEREAAHSIEQQRDIEMSDAISLDEYLTNYFNSD